jgi:hypothetical protein
LIGQLKEHRYPISLIINLINILLRRRGSILDNETCFVVGRADKRSLAMPMSNT